ncbi:prepilin-type N-terminal cleavage/methylation domain-containing protein [Metabacillus herbersteinensis]|uniref:Prepilin-type N-terminal cleavage/methylation domain-containing protein n=1 Tax=Metabacillus herbersteinensis TaxID=283816 RepID=A0ABV6GFH0_9BACI
MLLRRIVNERRNENGLTLMEVLVVVVILGIIAAIAVPSILGMIEKVEADVCAVNRLEVERLYEREIVLHSSTHSEVLFSAFIQEHVLEPCPVEGVYMYKDGNVECSEHVHHSDKEDEGEEVPFL